MSQPPNTPEQHILAMRILLGALVGGVVFFLVVMLAVRALNPFPNGQIVSLISAGIAVLVFLMHLIVPNIVASQALQRSDINDDMELYGVYRMKLIVGLSMLESMAFLNIIACMVEGNWWSLAIAGWFVLWMLMMFPTRSRVEQWIETQRMNFNADNSYR